MANFTVNSLTTATTAASDNFMKSDTNGVLTKVSAEALANDLLNIAGIAPVRELVDLTIGSKVIKAVIEKVGKIITFYVYPTGSSSVTDAVLNTWTNCGAMPASIGTFVPFTMIVSDKKMVEFRYSSGQLQYRISDSSIWIQGVAATMTA